MPLQTLQIRSIVYIVYYVYLYIYIYIYIYIYTITNYTNVNCIIFENTITILHTLTIDLLAR